MEKKIGEIKELLENTPISDLPDVIQEFKQDERNGVIKLLDKYTTKYFNF